MKLILTVILLVAVTGFANAGTKRTDDELRATLEHYRQETLILLVQHIGRHTGCELAELVPVIANAHIEIAGGQRANAWVFPDSDFLAIFFNRNSKWNSRTAVVTWIHEAFHLTKRNGHFICGADNRHSHVPICRPLGVEVYASSDISNAIQTHLEDYHAWTRL